MINEMDNVVGSIELAKLLSFIESDAFFIDVFQHTIIHIVFIKMSKILRYLLKEILILRNERQGRIGRLEELLHGKREFKEII